MLTTDSSFGERAVAKQMIIAYPGALDAVMKAKGLTQTDLAQRSRVDRKTLRAINRGEHVKDTTVKAVVLGLGIPIRQLLVPPAPVQTEDARSSDEVGANSVLLRVVKAHDVKLLLTGAVFLNWKLFLDRIDSEGRDTLLNFEKLIGQWWSNLKTEGIAKESLAEQLRRLEIYNEVEAALAGLHKLSITVLGGEYLWWEMDERNYYEDNYCYEYTSSRAAILALVPSSVTAKRIEVDQGNVPPSVIPPSYPWPVFVNDVELKPRPSFARELDDEVPF
jgi:hypothetical protein